MSKVMVADAMKTASDFETEWQRVARQVRAFCSRAVDDPYEAEEIFQQVAIRAWRGYSTFNGDATFLTWVLAIARREVARAMSHRYERFNAETSLEVMVETDVYTFSTLSAIEAMDMDYGWLSEVTKIAATSGALTQTETAAILARLARPEDNWQTVGEVLGVSGTTCATIHCRAVPKLRMFLFMHRPDLLGGKLAIAAAFKRALVDKSNPLSGQEVEVFQQVVLEDQVRYRKAGWRLALRSACYKVITWLTLP
jgi:RNA polymerase sigma factor (sigma-70 family)